MKYEKWNIQEMKEPLTCQEIFNLVNIKGKDKSFGLPCWQMSGWIFWGKTKWIREKRPRKGFIDRETEKDKETEKDRETEKERGDDYEIEKER